MIIESPFYGYQAELNIPVEFDGSGSADDVWLDLAERFVNIACDTNGPGFLRGLDLLMEAADQADYPDAGPRGVDLPFGDHYRWCYESDQGQGGRIWFTDSERMDLVTRAENDNRR